MTEFEKLLAEQGEENVDKYTPQPVPATYLQGRVREALEKGLVTVSHEVKIERLRHLKLRGMYCSWERIEMNGIFKRD